MDLLLLFCLALSSCFSCSTQAMKVGERLSFHFHHSLGSFETKFQHFPASAQALSAASSSQPPILCIHGFGGNADHFRKNMPYLAGQGHATYGIDLLGYGYGDKPSPRPHGVNRLYNFDTWSDQVCAFIEEVVVQAHGHRKEAAILVCNSIGCLVGLQAAIKRPDLVRGLVLMNISLRLLHEKKQNGLERLFVPPLQSLLRETVLGRLFFQQVAQPETVRKILDVAYNVEKTKQPVDEETLRAILQPGLDPRAAEVFLDFISYSSGPLPEDLLPHCPVSVRLLWGEDDLWEPVEIAERLFRGHACLESFHRLPGAGHCPMDQVPDEVNEKILQFAKSVQRPSSRSVWWLPASFGKGWRRSSSPLEMLMKSPA